MGVSSLAVMANSLMLQFEGRAPLRPAQQQQKQQPVEAAGKGGEKTPVAGGAAAAASDAADGGTSRPGAGPGDVAPA